MGNPDPTSADSPWHRRAVGGLWEEVGALQFEFLVGAGLRTEDHLLDIGCGSLRGGVHFVRYLDPGNYCGTDKDPALLAAGRDELKAAGLEGRQATLIEDDRFELTRLDRRFDFALAQSLFTHLPLNSIMVCLLSVAGVLRKGGRFYATFFESPMGTRTVEPISHPRSDGPPIVSYPDADPYHYGFDAFQWLCEGTSLRPEYIGEWNHPRGQRMLAFHQKVEPPAGFRD